MYLLQQHIMWEEQLVDPPNEYITSFRSTLSTTQTGTTIFRRASGSCPTFPLHTCDSFSVFYKSEPKSHLRRNRYIQHF